MLSSFDLTGGAGKAASRLSHSIRTLGVDLRMEVQSRSGDASYVSESTGGWRKASNRLRPTLDRMPLLLYRSYCGSPWSNNLLPRRLHWAEVGTSASAQAQLIHLHWVGYGFLPISSLRKLPLPIVWTLHDSWAFTGGCHVPGDCRQYTEHCGRCPQLGSARTADLSRLVWQRKATSWAKTNLTLVAPSRWLAAAARDSSLFCDHEVHVIPNGLDLALFRPIDQQLCREVLSLPSEKKLIVFGAVSPFSDLNKGFDHLHQAVERIASGNDKHRYELVIFGASAAVHNSRFALPTHCVGPIHDEITMALLLGAADVTVVPSRSENLSNTIMESLACGTPVACFDIGGNGDMVEHRKNGYLARPFDADDLAYGIRWLMDTGSTSPHLRLNARAKCEREFAVEDIAQRYVSLYEALCDAAAHATA